MEHSNDDELVANFLTIWNKMLHSKDNMTRENISDCKDHIKQIRSYLNKIEERVVCLENENDSEVGQKCKNWKMDGMLQHFSKKNAEKSLPNYIPRSKVSDRTEMDNSLMKPRNDDCSPAKKRKSTSLIDPEWEVIDPTPDVHTLFIAFNKRFFWGTLESVEVRWSPRMYSCAGVCVYEGRRGMCSVRLSEPLLKLRPRSDLIETLLHEMIHAYLFVTHNDRDREGHGPEFHKHMFRINKDAGTNISVYHSFHEEVKLYQKHWWRCNGPCHDRPPFFGMVKRSMNRAPGPNDFWWTTHQATCGGAFIKVKEPEKTKKKQVTSPSKTLIGNGSKIMSKDIRNFFDSPTKMNGNSSTLNATAKTAGPKLNSVANIKKNFTNSTNNKASNTSSPFVKGSSSTDTPKFNSTKSGVGSVPRNGGVGNINGGQNNGHNIHGIGSFKNNDGASNVRKPNSTAVPGNEPKASPVNRVVGFGDLNGNSQKKKTSPSKTSTNGVFGGTGNKLGTSKPPCKSSGKIGGALMNRGTGTFVLNPTGREKTQPKTETKTDPFQPFKGPGQKLGQGTGVQNPLSSLLLQGTPSSTSTNSRSSSSSSSSSSSASSNRSKPSSTVTSSATKSRSATSSTSSNISQSNVLGTRTGFNDSVITISSNSSKPSSAAKSRSATSSTSSNISQSDVLGTRTGFNDSVITISDTELADLDLFDFDNARDQDGDDDVNCPVCNKSIQRDNMSIHLESCDLLNTTLQNMNNSSTLELSDDDDAAEQLGATSNASPKTNKNSSPEDPDYPCPCCSKPIPESQINKHLDECLSMITLEELDEF